MIKCAHCKKETDDYVNSICLDCWDDIRTRYGFEEVFSALAHADAAYDTVCIKLAEAEAEIVNLRKASYTNTRAHIKYDSYTTRRRFSNE